MAGGYSTESARRALPNNGANYSQLIEEGRGEVAQDNIHEKWIENIFQLWLTLVPRWGTRGRGGSSDSGSGTWLSLLSGGSIFVNICQYLSIFVNIWQYSSIFGNI